MNGKEGRSAKEWQERYWGPSISEDLGPCQVVGLFSEAGRLFELSRRLLTDLRSSRGTKGELPRLNHGVVDTVG